MSSDKRKRKDVTVDKTIKITVRLHRWLSVLQETKDGTFSQIIEDLVLKEFPDIEEAAQAVEKNHLKGIDAARKFIDKESDSE